jgi:hypothetical protein
MKKLFASPDSAEVGLVKSLLEEAGIPCEIRNEHLSPALPGAPFYPELWVLNDDDYSRAAELFAAWDRPATSGGAAWSCPQCGEVLEAQFTACWKCGTVREPAA